MILDFIASYAVQGRTLLIFDIDKIVFELLFDLNIKNRLKDYFEIRLVNVVHLTIKFFAFVRNVR